MNYPNAERNSPRGPNLFLLVMLAAMALFLYSQYQKGSRNKVSMPEVVIPDISNDAARPVAGERPGWDRSGESPNRQDIAGPQTQPSGNSDWEIDTDVQNLPSSYGTGNPTASRATSNDTVSNGDWSLESQASTPSDGSTLDPRNSKPKTTEKGDWSLGEVETQKK